MNSIKPGKKRTKKTLSTVHQEFSKFSKCLQHIRYLLKETHKAFHLIERDENFKNYIKKSDIPTHLPEDEENELNNVLNNPISIVVLGQTAYAKAVVINEIFRKKVVPLPSTMDDSTSAANWRMVRFKYGSRQTLSLVIPEENYDLGDSLSAYHQPWDTIPEADLVLHGLEVSDPANQAAVLDVTLNDPILRDGARILMSSSCRYDNIEEVEQLVKRCCLDTLPIIIYAGERDELTVEDKLELEACRRIISDQAILFIRVPDLATYADICEQRDSTPNKPSSGDLHAIPVDLSSSTGTNSIGSSIDFSERESEDLRLLQDLCSLGFVFTVETGLSPPHSPTLGEGGDRRTPPIPSNDDAQLADLPVNCELVRDLSKDFMPRLVSFVRSTVRRLLIRAVSLLYSAQSAALHGFVLQAYDLAYDLMMTPKRLEFARAQEAKLFTTLLAKTEDKQTEMAEMIKDTLDSLRMTVPEAKDVFDVKGVPNDKPLSFRNYKIATNHIRETVLQQVNSNISERLLKSIDVLRETYLGTLERCLTNLEECSEETTCTTTEALKNILSSTYGVAVPFKTSSSYVRNIIEKMKLLLQSLPWQPGPIFDEGWKRKVATEMLESLSDVKISREVCGQVSERLRDSHDGFSLALRRLEVRIDQKTSRSEEVQDRIRRTYAPRLARLSLESTSIRDAILFGSPQMGREIGRGQYGVVYSCTRWGNYQPVAVKSVVPPDDKHWNDLALEFYYTKQLPEHDRIVALRGSVIDYTYGGGGSPAVLLIMERLIRDLHLAIKQSLDFQSRLQVGLDVVEGLRFLHSQGLIHRDIKLKNVLLDGKNRGKLTDLGFCKPHAMMSGSVVGTPIHMAPELFTGRYDCSVDVYAFGILFWYICAGKVRLPYNFEQCSNKDMLWSAVKKGVRPERLAFFESSCWNLMERCWHNDPGHRPLPGDLASLLERVYLSVSMDGTIQASRPRAQAIAGPFIPPGLPGPDSNPASDVEGGHW